MAACTFFGHQDAPASVMPRLRSVLVELIQQRGVDQFYVGRQGDFDAMVRRVLVELAEIYPHISYAVVLERLPTQRDAWNPLPCDHTLFPEGLETVPPRFAIHHRNEWMLGHSDFVVTYITRRSASAVVPVSGGDAPGASLLRV
ncbi:hypothetical protein [Intestinimonas sp. MSJ-38]|uniref:hypothetical protein n=1 Tax=Intestinimonas sp. MSJ-38 TaxID=2841532 RepID=UPI001C10AA00|nr:hypothetical protein [Intestinimonas sp. MSJ-38]MBU5433385.1 hypothetical protein [Intestinimonas sp. MSJ-38]